MVEMRYGGDVPRVTGQGARDETWCVVDEMSDDHFDDFHGKLGERRRACRWNLWRSIAGTECLDSVPNSFGKQLDHCR